MSDETSGDITLQLRQLRDGEKEALDRLLPRVYEQLRRLAQDAFRHQRQGHTLQPTALVHDAWVRLVSAQSQDYNDRIHFFRVAAVAMRQILTDHARSRARDKRGGGMRRVSVEEELQGADGVSIDLLALQEALEALRAMNERQAEVVELRFVAGLSTQEIADLLGIAERTVRLDWQMARAWLERRMQG